MFNQILLVSRAKKHFSNTSFNSTESKRIHCDKCERKFNKEATYKVHMENNHGEITNEMNKQTQVSVTFLTEKRNLRSVKKPSSAQLPNN